MKRIIASMIVAALAIVSFVPFVPAASAPPGAKKSASAPVQASPPPEWQKKWNGIVGGAKKEGELNLYVSGNWGSELRAALTKIFKDNYGINLNISPFGGSAMVVKVKEEQRAGLFIADVFGAGVNTFLLNMKPDNLLRPIDQLLVLPEVTDPKAWDGGQLFTFDKDHTIMSMLRVINRSVVYNTDLLKAGEFDSYRDFLKPRFKGKLTMPDPAGSGPGGWFANHLVDIYGYDEGLKFLKDLIYKQDTAIQRDARLHIESVARGKYAVALGGGTQYIADFLSVGAHIAVKIPKEGDGGGASFGALAVPVKSPHPYAATLFVNWLLTKEGQSVFAKYTGNPSRRLDASVEGVNPVFLPLPGEKVAWDTAEFYLRRNKVIKAAKEILAQAKSKEGNK